MKIVKKLLKKGNNHCLSSANTQQKENLNNARLFRAKARRTIKSAKRKSWRTYVSKLNYKTPIKKVWDMIRKISGKSKSASNF